MLIPIPGKQIWNKKWGVGSQGRSRKSKVAIPGVHLGKTKKMAADRRPHLPSFLPRNNGIPGWIEADSTPPHRSLSISSLGLNSTPTLHVTSHLYCNPHPPNDHLNFPCFMVVGVGVLRTSIVAFSFLYYIESQFWKSMYIISIQFCFKNPTSWGSIDASDCHK